MKTAKEMFEEQGFILKEETKSYIRYFRNFLGYGSGDYVSFDLKNKRFRLTNKTVQGNVSFRYAGVKELQAINKQVEELGWE